MINLFFIVLGVIFLREILLFVIKDFFKGNVFVIVNWKFFSSFIKERCCFFVSCLVGIFLKDFVGNIFKVIVIGWLLLWVNFWLIKLE